MRVGKAPLSWKALKRLHDNFADSAIPFCNQGEGLAPEILVLFVGEDGDIERMFRLSPNAMQHFMSSSEGKEELAEAMRGFLNPEHELHRGVRDLHGFAPNAVIQVTEAWLVKVTCANAKSLAEVEHGHVDGVPVSEHPARREVLLIAVHTREASIPVMHEISTTNDGLRLILRAPFPEEASPVVARGTFAVGAANSESGTSRVHALS
jgi:hypothetical protein